MFNQNKIQEQLCRDLACILVFLIAVAIFVNNLSGYLSQLQRPAILKFSFVGSLIISLLYEINKCSWRFTLINATRTAIIFSVGVLVGHYLRDQYLAIREQIVLIPDIRDLIGDDLLSALMNPVVGYGGCFAAGTMTIRLVFSTPIERSLIRAFVLSKNRPAKCQHCNQTAYQKGS